MSPEEDEQRKHLVQAEQESVASYDKAILSLAAGGLGVSMAFVKDIVDNKVGLPFHYLYWSWTVWGVSVTSTLASFYTSRLALRKAIRQIDARMAPTGGKATVVTEILNALSGISFLAGTALLALFVRSSLGGK